MLDMQKTFIVKFNEDVCLAICQFYYISSKRVELHEVARKIALSNKALNKFATLY